MPSEAQYQSRSSIAAKSTSTWRTVLSAIRIASRYNPLFTCRSISLTVAALDSSYAESTLEQI